MHRASVPYSSQFAIQEQTFIETGKGDNLTYYKLEKKEKECLDSFGQGALAA